MSLLAQFQLERGISVRPSAARNGQQRSLFTTPPPVTTPPSPGSRPPSPASGIEENQSRAQGERRPRSSSLELASELEEQRQMKKRKQHALDTCRDHQLDEKSLEKFAELDVHEMLITVHGKLLALERARERDDLNDFIHSEQFKEIMKDRLRSCLLSPNLTAYLEQLPENVWAFMKKNVTVFKIPPKALEDPELSEDIDRVVKEVLTKQRAVIKSKVGISIKSKHHISVLARTLSSNGCYLITAGQWARFAFLRASWISFGQLVMTSMSKKVDMVRSKEADAGDAQSDNDLDHDTDDNNADRDGNGDTPSRDKQVREWNDRDFWEYVDTLLSDLRATLEEQHPAEDARKAALTSFFTQCLQADLKTYPATKRNAAVPYAEEHLLSDWVKAIHQSLVW